MKAFAEREGLDKKRLYYWKKALVNKGVLPRSRRARFHRAKVIHPDTYRPCDWRVQLPNGVSVSFAGEVQAKVLALVLNTAARLG